MHRPTSVTVFGILNLIFGGLGMCGLVFLGVDNNALDQGYQKVGLAVQFIFSVVLIAAGIGLLRLCRWGRILSITWAGYAIVSIVVGIVAISIAVLNPQQPQYADVPAIVPVALLLIHLIFPFLLLYFMLRPHVKAAFQPLQSDAAPAARPAEETGNPYQSP